MLRKVCMTMIALAVPLAGCGSPTPPTPKPPPPGFITMDPPADITDPHGMATDYILRPAEKVTTKHILKGRITYVGDGNPYDYDILMGPYPYAGAGSVSEAEGWFLNRIPRFYIKSGWVIAAGDWPMVETELVDACGHGCTVVVQIVDSLNHNVFILKNPDTTKTSKLTVTLKSGTTAEYLTADTEDKYVEVKKPWLGAVTMSPIKTLSSAPTSTKNFITDLKIWANRARINETPYLNP